MNPSTICSSGGNNKLAPSKCTVYVSNIPFSLTNNDLYKIFEKYGRVVRVTIMKDKHTRKSKGVAFVLFLDRDSAYTAVRALNKTKMFERTISCSIAKDNGRAPEFIRRREYLDKSKCYECGEEGHLSYKCPKNLLGEREPPPKKKKKRKFENEEESNDNDSDDMGTNSVNDESLAMAVRYQQSLIDSDVTSSGETSTSSKRKKYKKDSYFSDEEELDD
ncbi:Zinc finger CCHC-type and RNA-binding motif-containing protein 1 [Biomphalaria glabrata]|uniref:Zinc finger CCHC-type and RNA-binding motif-containing protein 1 n=2 Tax=Biomphalaria glabrata TaxID=6526 RepID=A0A9W3A4S7_BIOGL|nr:zinc finger CCHC-type and RNA-binding motif-containing protein 1-like [Biomphalaria glabrata]KAI8735535.1 zinc finger CCHC-type and RNA-binding motif-containing protein 1-like [Biomphalaria glabrata]KAI8764016.1 zinc finger CCHC-type and RNA-binding motif-containing protein 1 [Biomphalaria glabrata]